MPSLQRPAAAPASEPATLPPSGAKAARGALAETALALLRNQHAATILHRIALLILQVASVHQSMDHTGCVTGVLFLLLSRHLFFSLLRTPKLFQLSPSLSVLVKVIISTAFVFDFCFFVVGIMDLLSLQQALVVVGVPFILDAGCAVCEGPLWPAHGFTSFEDWAAVFWSACEAAFYIGVVPLQLAQRGVYIEREMVRSIPLLVFINTVVR